MSKVSRDRPIAEFAGTHRLGYCAAAVAAAALSCMLASCSPNVQDGVYRDPARGVTTGGAAGTAVTEGGQFNKDMSNFFLGQTGPDTVVTASGGDSDIECPAIDIRPGASTLTIPPGGGSGALALRYQGTIAQLSRNCLVTAGTVRMKVGVRGRVILGPAGGPGKFDIPLRYAVVHEGPEPKTIVTKFYRVPLTVAEGEQNVPFLHIDDNLTFPMPKADDIESYVVYVGFDAAGDKPPPPVKKPAAKPAPKPAPKPGPRAAR